MRMLSRDGRPAVEAAGRRPSSRAGLTDTPRPGGDPQIRGLPEPQLVFFVCSSRLGALVVKAAGVCDCISWSITK